LLKKNKEKAEYGARKGMKKLETETGKVADGGPKVGWGRGS